MNSFGRHDPMRFLYDPLQQRIVNAHNFIDPSLSLSQYRKNPFCHERRGDEYERLGQQGGFGRWEREQREQIQREQREQIQREQREQIQRKQREQMRRENEMFAEAAAYREQAEEARRQIFLKQEWHEREAIAREKCAVLDQLERDQREKQRELEQQRAALAQREREHRAQVALLEHCARARRDSVGSDWVPQKGEQSSLKPALQASANATSFASASAFVSTTSSAQVAPVAAAEDKSCVVCMDNERNIVCLPCKHLAMCVQCGNGLTKCPICQQNIADSIKCIVS